MPRGGGSSLALRPYAAVCARYASGRSPTGCACAVGAPSRRARALARTALRSRPGATTPVRRRSLRVCAAAPRRRPGHRPSRHGDRPRRQGRRSAGRSTAELARARDEDAPRDRQARLQAGAYARSRGLSHGELAPATPAAARRQVAAVRLESSAVLRRDAAPRPCGREPRPLGSARRRYAAILQPRP